MTILNLPRVLLSDGQYMPRVGFEYSSSSSGIPWDEGVQMIDVTTVAAASALQTPTQQFLRKGVFCVMRVNGENARMRIAAARPWCSGRIGLLLLQPSLHLDDLSIQEQWKAMVQLQDQGQVGSLGLASVGKTDLLALYAAGHRPAVVYAVLSSVSTASEDVAMEELTRLCEEHDTVLVSTIRYPEQDLGRHGEGDPRLAVMRGHSALRRGHAHIFSQTSVDLFKAPLAPFQLNRTASWQRPGIFGHPLQEEDWSYHMFMVRSLGEVHKGRHCPIVRMAADEADPLLAGSTKPGGPFLRELRVAPRLQLPAAGMRSAGSLDKHRWRNWHRPADCASPSKAGAGRAAWTDWAACVTAGTFQKMPPDRFGSVYAARISAIRSQVAALAAAWEASGEAMPLNQGTQHLMHLLAWPSTQAVARVNSASSLERGIHTLVSEHIQPWLEKNVYLGARLTLKQFSVSRNAHAKETVRQRGTTWHWDTLPNGLTKAIIYLTDVDDTHGCMVVMLHNGTRAAFKMAGTKAWGKLASPASVPKEWLLDLMDRGYRPTCADGAAGTAVFFDTNIVHRASRPAAGNVRDSINLEFILEKVASPRQQRLARQHRRSLTRVRKQPVEDHHPQQPSVAGFANLSNLVIPVMGSSKVLPAVGYGTANRKTAKGPRLVTSLVDLFALGGRHIDTAVMYKNYAEIRAAIERSRVPRGELWITSKLNTNRKLERLGGFVTTAGGAYDSVVASVSALGGPIDLMLIHTPAESAEERIGVWRGLINAQKMGHVRVIGVSNFNSGQIEELKAATGVLPAVNEFEYNPWVPASTHSLLRWCIAKGIAVLAYNSLGGKKNRARGSAVARLARKLRAGNAQVLLRWALQHGARVIPGATSKAHIAENMNLSSFSLSAADMAELETSRRPAQLAAYGAPGTR